MLKHTKIALAIAGIVGFCQILYAGSLPVGQSTDRGISTVHFGNSSTATQAKLDLKANDAEVVHLTGSETITGQKTFSQLPIGAFARLSSASGAVNVTGLSTMGVKTTGGVTATTSDVNGIPTITINGGTGTITGVTATAPIVSSGGATPV